MNKYTPGPWKVVDNHPQRSAIDIREDSNLHVASLYICPTTDTETKDEKEIVRNDDERIANARLIAVAPEMFDELERVITNCEICDVGFIEYRPSGIDGYLPTGDANFVTESCPNCSNARAIVAKVKGES